MAADGVAPRGVGRDDVERRTDRATGHRHAELGPDDVVDQEVNGDPRLLEGHPTSGLAFHPSLPLLATLDHRDRWVRVWDYEEGA